MRIAVVDVAAEKGGALSVLTDFLEFVTSVDDDTNEYFVFVSKAIDIIHPRIHFIQKPEVKKSWFSRLKWERFKAMKEFVALNIDVIFSMQNTAFYSNHIKQCVYFHNALLLEPKEKYSLFKKSERIYGIYTRLIAPYTIKSMKYADLTICQTKTIRGALLKANPKLHVEVVSPNVRVEEKYINSATYPINGYIYPTAAVPFKRIEEIVECIKQHEKWFTENRLEMLITIDGTENTYAQKVFEIGKSIPCIKFIGYQTRDKILELYSRYALVINSELESYPIPYREAELVGTPILSADYPYAREILKDNEKSRLFRHGDIESMFQAFVDTRGICTTSNISIHKNSWCYIYNLLMNLKDAKEGMVK